MGGLGANPFKPNPIISAHFNRRFGGMIFNNMGS